MTADASVLLLLSFVNATFRVEIKWCLFLCVLRATCIFRKDYFRKQCICCKVWFRFEKTHRTRKKCPKNLSVTMLRWMVFFTRTWEKFGWTFRALSLPLHSFHRQKPTEKLNLHLRPMKHHFGGGWHFRSPVLNTGTNYEDLSTRRISEKFQPRLLTNKQKQQKFLAAPRPYFCDFLLLFREWHSSFVGSVCRISLKFRYYCWPSYTRLQTVTASNAST